VARNLAILLGLLTAGAVATDANGRSTERADALAPIVGRSATLAPFQHVRFCLRYPADCQPNSVHNARVEFNPQTIEQIRRVNNNVNQAIAPRDKNYEKNLKDGWTIAPSAGDCNDYAVTKRHMLLKNGFPSSALLLSVIKTPSGVGHLVLIVATTRQDVVMDNLTDAVLPWQETNYRWLKIQSAIDPRNWNQVDQATALGSFGSQAYNDALVTNSQNAAHDR
jgi:predicted transglutaminase-like cysteine proteinase